MSSLIRFDWALKGLLRDKANFVVLEGFISTVIQKDVKIVEILKSESSLKHDKQGQNGLGILCETKNEKHCIVEVQVNCQISFLLDMLFTTNETVNEYFKQGKYYGAIPQVYSINIGHFESSLGTDYVYKSTMELVGLGLHNNNELDSNELQADDKLVRDLNNICPKYWVLDVAGFKGIIKSPLDEWIYYFKNDKIEDSFTAKGLKEAKKLLDLDLLSKEERQQYKAYETSLRDASSLLQP